MMNCSAPPQRRSTSLANEHGAVVLLSIYITSLALLVLSTVSLQRTIANLHNAEHSRDLEQAFFLAEGALDYALAQTAVYQDGVEYDVAQELGPGSDFPTNGTATFSMITTGAGVVDPDTQEVTRQIIATGQSRLGLTAQVSATVSQRGPLKGAWNEGPMWIKGGAFGNPGLFHADIRSSLGIVESIKLSGVEHVGQLQIAPSAASEEDYLVTHMEDRPWKEPIGNASGIAWGTEQPGVYLQTFMGVPSTTNGTTDMSPTVLPMTPAPTIPSPYSDAQCSGSITQTETGDLLEITDGHSLDLTGGGDGKIELCLQYIYAAADQVQPNVVSPHIIFKAPATIYLTGKNSDGLALKVAGGLYATQPGYANSVTAPLIPNGVKIRVTETPEGEPAGKVIIRSTRFDGSIYAPHSKVGFITAPHGEYTLRNLVARESEFLTFSIPVMFEEPPESSTTPKASNDVKGWQTE